MRTLEAMAAVRIALLEAVFFALLAACIWPVTRRMHRLVLWPLIALALMSVASFFNFGGLQAGGAIHAHDAFHYFMGVKYFRDLGYFNLYRATVVAAQELGRGPVGVRQIRDLATQRLERVDLESFERVKDAFSPERWTEFKDDLSVFIQRSPDWQIALTDFGNVAPPTRTALLAPLLDAFELTPARLMILCHLDFVLLALSFSALGYAFGVRTALLALTFFGLNYLNGYSWIGGSVLRYDWICAVLLGLAALGRDRPMLAGMLVAYAASIRIFPLCFLAIVAIKLILSLRSRLPDRRTAAFLAGAAIAILSIALVTALVFPGLSIYQEYADRLKIFSTKASISRISFLELERYFFLPVAPGVDAPGGSALAPVLGLAVVVLSLGAIRSATLLESLQFGCAPIFFFGHITSYYYVFPVLFFILPLGASRTHVFDLVKMMALCLLSMAGDWMDAARFPMQRTHAWMSMGFLIFYTLALVLDRLRPLPRFAAWTVLTQEPEPACAQAAASSPGADTTALP